MEPLQVPEPARTGYARAGDGSELYYELYCSGLSKEHEDRASAESWPRAMFIMGFACTCDCWAPQLDGLLQQEEERPLEICVVDNRGIGRSSKPAGHKSYTTVIMANDVVAVADQLGWAEFHCVGFSLGAMVSTKVASMYSERIRSLSLLGVTGGRWQTLPATWRSFKLFVKSMFVKSPEDKAKMTVKFHFSRRTLEERVGFDKFRRKDVLFQEYLQCQKATTPQAGLHGQLMACLKHNLSKKDISQIRGGEFPVQLIHGRHDVVAHKKYARRIAKLLAAQLVEVEGGHMITRECGHEVNRLLAMSIMYPYTRSDRSRHLDRTMRRKSEG
ncbi:unnamed protein product [Ostreobium quekettii]|uniref:AB hydrolase-1 domain-containing protein n=1 Tax=Ostreobium quekettii TaxID=121088 RepID=A0A8S1J573_9CHLO|nr:unnamed protein product [Ostreobium quekettii]